MVESRTGHPRGAYLHLSIDDVHEDVMELFRHGDQGPPWQHPTFAFLQDLRTRYGVAISLFLFLRAGRTSLAAVDDRHRRAFAGAAHWLRFGFHGEHAGTTYGPGADPVEAADHYRAVVRAVATFAGEEALDRVPRTHTYSGHREVVRAWRDEPHGILGLLTPEDDREAAYHLSRDERAHLLDAHVTYDARERLALARTDLRLEHCEDPVAALRTLHRPTEPRGLRVFTHADRLGEPRMRAAIVDVAAWAHAEGVPGAFPQDRWAIEVRHDAPSSVARGG